MAHDSLDSYLNQRLKDPNFKQLWAASESQFQLTRSLIRERLNQKLSQRQLARKAKTTQAVISRIESMAVNPSLSVLNKIAVALGKQLIVNLK